MSHLAATLPGMRSRFGARTGEDAMNQVELALAAQEPEHEDAIGFRIGWDHAHHGLVPPPELLLDGTPIGQGWRAGRAVFGGPAAPARPWPANRHTRLWLALRIEAWRAAAPFDLASVTPNHLAQIEVRRCPARRVALGGGVAGDAPAATRPDTPRVERLNAEAAYAAGNLVMLSAAAAEAWRGLGVHDLVRRARLAEAAQAAQAGEPGSSEPPDRAGSAQGTPLDAAAWWRLATLRSLATPLAPSDAARLPLAALPPNRVRVLNAAQALQALLTLRMAHADWCARIGAVTALLPTPALRTDFNLWVGALAPRLLEAQAGHRDVTTDFGRVLEDAWLGERVQRRWQSFVLSLGEPACEQLVQRLAALGLPGRRAEVLAWEQAIDGWELPQRVAADAAGRIKPEPAPARAEPAAAPAAAPPASRRRTAPTPWPPRPRATAGPRPAAR
jgi:hypothetical protein